MIGLDFKPAMNLLLWKTEAIVRNYSWLSTKKENTTVQNQGITNPRHNKSYTANTKHNKPQPYQTLKINKL